MYRTRMENAHDFLPVGSVKPRGWIEEQMKRCVHGMGGHMDEIAGKYFGKRILFHDKITPEDIDSIFHWWPAETEGNWADGFVRMALSAGIEWARNKAEDYVAALLRNQDDDGYIGVYDRACRYSDDVVHNGELWTQSRALLILLAYYEATGEQTVLDALYKAAVLTASKYGPAAGNRSYFCMPEMKMAAGGPPHGLMMVETLLRIYDLIGDEKLLEFAEFLYDDFSAADNLVVWGDMNSHAVADEKRPFTGHGAHTCEHLRVPLMLYYYTGRRDLLESWEKGFAKMKENLLPSGGCKADEMMDLAVPGALQEYCCITELTLSLQEAHALTGETIYADMAEKIVHNAAQGGRAADERSMTYFSSDNTEASSRRGLVYSPINVCCASNAVRMLPYYLDRMWLRTGKDSLTAAFLGPCEVSSEINGVKVSISEITSYPFEDGVEFVVRPEKPVEFSLKIRVPGWCGGVSFVVQEEQLEARHEDGHVTVTGCWRDETTLHIALQPGIRVGTAIDGTAYLMRGPLLFSYAIPCSMEAMDSIETYPLPEFHSYDIVLDENARRAYSLVLDEDGEAGEYVRLSRQDAEPAAYPWEQPPIALEATAADALGVFGKISLRPLGSTLTRTTAFPYVKLPRHKYEAYLDRERRLLEHTSKREELAGRTQL